MNSLTELIPRGVTFIAGSEKNAGKTALLNLLLAQLRGRGKTGYLSIGVDGESRDMIFGNPKPRIYARPGDLVATSQAALSAGCPLKIAQLLAMSVAIVLAVAVYFTGMTLFCRGELREMAGEFRQRRTRKGE